MNKRILGLLAFPAIVGSMLVPTGSASAVGGAPDSVIDPPGIHFLSTMVGQGKCLAVPSNGAYGSTATLVQCAAFDDQSWTVPQAGTTGVIQNKYFKNTYGTGCLTAQGGIEGNPAFIYNCTELRDQLWSAELVPGRNGAVRYRNVNSNGLCLTAQGSSVGTAAIVYRCLDFADQIWAA
ncbi:RICIN domain-containing protein [Kitasatospora sp. NPDC091207]|uniref:RICIN domain-containing protein n=1 Tax=Kitasatospora sp. NPDC091207 TaxID=3364083 RepID=UPI00382DBBA5